MKAKFLPRRLHWLFWDVDAKKLDYQKCDIYVIKRLIEHGNEFAIGWLFKNYNGNLGRGFKIG
ncbi:MAG: hypothetical protein UV54_C0021G0006 [Candidatus Beckwithbacteria bacterium GW2011_GWA2_43_10]|uniref:DUF6922 domain-containing protein n=1 Tax=Candidatus Beckwithbacteria bacterium GW2011_GWA2_43_10 TaxID=1618369 RepID=A0A0G1C2V7_9BACT|nr:MAG: hypothetical protein UV54_C0021G0006 [Candidatus Beckwithbacteria bacterium GW2011_GWA2_43_10]